MVTPTDGDLPPLRAARRAGLIDQVIDQLRQQITAGAWPIGSRIPTESELAGLTGTSRNTVREAVQSLVHAGLLERRQGSGTYVLAASELAGAISRRVTGEEPGKALETWRALEVGLARLAATRRTEGDVTRLRDLLSRRTEALRAGRADAAVSLDLDLHRAIGVATQNGLLAELQLSLLSGVRELPLTDRLLAADPTDLVEAVAARDADRAASAAARLLSQGDAGDPTNGG